MRLYDSTIPSGNAYKVSLLLSHLGLECEVVELDILASPSQTREASYLAKNPNGRIPALELDDGRVLAESNAILCYLADGTEYLPADRWDRAQVLQWLFFEQYSHEPYVAVLKFFTYWGGLENLSDERRAMVQQRGQQALDVMERALAQRPFLAGDRYTVADIALFAYTQSASAVGYAVGPATGDWLSRVRQQPGYVAIKPNTVGVSHAET